ncbi:vWA domain-containing protein [Rubrobacter indicoceani]|uniref:vWA domain-containing protein n=1 Tax=Rubrobacter indicoceani TaxID=2051957 RepID=UPI001968FB6F|nr:hypothetical protein [Rubrobacter indicoceani]
MKKDLTEIVCVLDRSGSMEAIRSDAVGGFNGFLDDQKREPGEARLTLVLFDHCYKLVHDGVDIHSVPALAENSYAPRGTTALLDAIGRTIDDVGDRLRRTPENRRPSRVVVSILTDGLENASRDYSNARVSEMIQHQQEKYGWEFIFLAANQDAISTAKSVSIEPQNSFAFISSPDGIREAHAMMSRHFTRRRRGVSGADEHDTK